MIPVHRLSHPDVPVWLNPDLIQLVETTPDTVVALTNGARLVVQETPSELVRLVREWRASVVALAATPPDVVKNVVPLSIT
jgi:flagellar protein FlbD